MSQGMTKISRLLFLPTLLAILAPVLMGASSSSCQGATAGPTPSVIAGPGRTTFADLGWEHDAVISDGTPATVRFTLPDNASQGDPLWYGLHLKFNWQGNPGEVGDYAFLYGRWNNKSVYQFQTMRISELDQGYEWSMSDMVNGNSEGYELGDSIQVTSTNIAQLKSISGGLNELTLSLSLGDASNKNITAIVSKESEIIASSWQPTFIDGEATAKVEDNVVDVKLDGKNLGWGTDSFMVTVRVWSGVFADSKEWELGSLLPHANIDFEERLVLEQGREPHRVDVEVDWPGGRQFFIAWDPTNNPQAIPFLGSGIFRSVAGLMVAVAVLWIAAPALVAAIKERRRA